MQQKPFTPRANAQNSKHKGGKAARLAKALKANLLRRKKAGK